VSSYIQKKETSDWKLVRQVKPGKKWHSASDELKGTESYGKRQEKKVGSNKLEPGTFSLPF
jgi:hypothetical protein